MSEVGKRLPIDSQKTSEIVVEGLVRTFGNRAALDGLTARIGGERITGLVGPDGWQRVLPRYVPPAVYDKIIADHADGDAS